jgi:eukaryotic-like serine/threonine-protein kinase
MALDEARRARVDRIFCEALERPAGERGAWLDEHCAGDPALRSQVEQLLAAAEADDEFLAPGGALRGETWRTLFAERIIVPPPKRIGAYRIVRELGRGGMSVVYLGERADGVFEQRVALKLVKPGADTEEVLQRFEQERQILASLSHPAIARLYDGGSTDSGHPYFVMELVQGEPIDAWCRERRLGFAERLSLFTAVCDAVQHAHSRRIVHRDLKPSNILVRADGEVKLLDFGIAKALDPKTLPHAVPATQLALRPLTPEFASPEQLRGEPVTAASDVYQLGVLLYQLLTNRLPYELEREGTEALVRAICDRPPRPPKLGRELDTIVLMALRKEPERRYATAAGLAADLRRHLAGEPLAARRDALLYRARKRLQRHASSIVAAAAVVLAAAALGLGLLGPPRDELAAEPAVLAVLPFANLSGQAEDDYFGDGIAEELIDRLAQGGLPVIARTSSFAFKDDLRPVAEMAALLGASHLLEGSLRREGERLRITAKLIDARGRPLWSERFDRRTESIFEVQDEIAGAVVANVAPALQLARGPQLVPTESLDAYRHYLRGKDFERRRPAGWLPEALEAFRLAIDLDPEFAAAWAGFAVASRLSVQWAPEPEVEIGRAQQAIDRALAIDPLLAEAHAAQGLMYSMHLREPGASEAAEASLRRAIELNPRHVHAYNWLAIVLSHQQRYADSSEIRQAALDVDPLNPLLLLNAGQTAAWGGRYEEAKRRFLSVLRLPNPPAWTHDWLASLEASYGRFDEALAWIQHGVDSLPEPHRYQALARGAEYYARLGLFDEAYRVLAQAEAGLRAPRELERIRLLHAERRHAELEPFVLRMLAERRVDISRAPDWLSQHLAIAQVLNGSHEAGIGLLEEILQGHYTHFSNDQVEGAGAVQHLAYGYQRTGRVREAEQVLAILRDALEAEREVGGARGPVGTAALARTYALLGQGDEALALLEEAVAAGWRDYVLAADDPRWGSVRGLPRFEALMANVRADVERQRDRVLATRPLLAAAP